jgi:membrane complex biogenesis BtpA family protein
MVLNTITNNFGDLKMRIKEFNSLFKTEKPIIGVIHLPPLPGAPRNKEKIVKILESALEDAKKLEEGGINGIIVENYGDVPYYPESVPPETITSMTVICHEISKKIHLPLGINVLRNDAKTALAIALATKASFIRVNVHISAMLTDQGLIQGKAHETLRYRSNLKIDTKIFADIKVKHAKPLTPPTPIEEEAKEAIHRGQANAIIITGKTTGIPPNPENILKVKQALPETPCLIGSGITQKNAKEMLKIADGCIVGTSIKINKKTENPVDTNLLKKLINTIHPHLP